MNELASSIENLPSGARPNLRALLNDLSRWAVRRPASAVRDALEAEKARSEGAASEVASEAKKLERKAAKLLADANRALGDVENQHYERCRRLLSALAGMGHVDVVRRDGDSGAVVAFLDLAAQIDITKALARQARRDAQRYTAYAQDIDRHLAAISQRRPSFVGILRDRVQRR